MEKGRFRLFGLEDREYYKKEVEEMYERIDKLTITQRR